MPCEYGDNNQSRQTSNCDDDPTASCLYWQCAEDKTILEKCTVPADFNAIEDTVLPAEAECELLSVAASESAAGASVA